jgi:1-acyl-sn-glycerol-3-phosphate acyltransferase
MGEGRINRTIEHGITRTSELKARMPELKERLPEFKERTAELKERIPEFKERTAELKERAPELSSQLRTKGTELRSKSAELVARQYQKMDVEWARHGLARSARAFILSGILGPMMDYYTRLKVYGREVLDDETLEGPVIFVANHSSHLDTPTVLRAIPFHWRSRTAVAAAADYFYKSRWKANAVALAFNTVPLGRNGGGLGNGATDHVDKLIDEQWSLLLFPEGTRSRDGKIGKVKSGAAVMAAQHGLTIVPIYIGGTYDAMPPGQNWPKRIKRRFFFSKRHKLEVRFGDPIPPRDASERHAVMDEVKAFWERKGRPADPERGDDLHNVLLIHEVLRAHENELEELRSRRFEHVERTHAPAA